MKKKGLLTLFLIFAWSMNTFGEDPQRQPSSLSGPKKVMVIILENESFNKAIAEPYLAQLAKEGALLKNYHGVTHPSQPNYVALVAGDTFKVTNDHSITLDQENIADLLEKHGKTWKVYAEDYPGSCSLTERTKQYAKKHNPLLSFKGIQESPQRCKNPVNPLNKDI